MKNLILTTLQLCTMQGANIFLPIHSQIYLRASEIFQFIIQITSNTLMLIHVFVNERKLSCCRGQMQDYFAIN